MTYDDTLGTMEVITTTYGNVHIRRIDSGAPLVIVHGGPGLDHTYLYEWLLPLAKYRTLIFYDQLGCGEDRTPLEDCTATSVISQLAALLTKLDILQNVSFLAHSWGTYVVLSLLQEHPEVKCSSLLLSNPIALTYDRESHAGERLMKRIPSNVLHRVEALESQDLPENRQEIMQMLLPYYVAHEHVPTDLSCNFYHSKLAEQIMQQIGEFDIRSAASAIPAKTLLLYGDADFEESTDCQELLDHGAACTIIENAGHFPFAEQPQRFLETAIAFL